MTELSTTALHTTAPPVSFNLWHQPWIRVTDLQGRAQEVGIGACLEQAHTLYALHDPSPLVVGGTHRLLTAIVQALYAPESLADIEAVLEDGRFDSQRLAEFTTQHAERFDLFHVTAPFLQSGDIALNHQQQKAKCKSVVSLFNEVPGATNRIHFHHVTDDSHKVCPACCARGLVTFPSFASSGGSGIAPSINGVPPMYVLPAGDNLFESLALSLTTPDYQPKLADPDRSTVAAWNSATTVAEKHEVSGVGYLESLLFPARRMRLFPLVEHATCTHCGSPTEIIVCEMVFDMGHRRKKAAATWDDPFIALQKPRGKGEPRPVRPQAGKALWREYTTLLLTSQDQHDLLPPIVRQTGHLVNRETLNERQALRFRCIGVRTDGKAKFFEWLDEALDVPPRLLVDGDGTLFVADALRRAEAAAQVLTYVFNRHFRPERERGKPIRTELVRFQSLRSRMQAMFWERLAAMFPEVIRNATDPQQRPAVNREWVDTLLRVGQQTFNETADQAGDEANALRIRVEAQAECRRTLYAKRKEWIGDE